MMMHNTNVRLPSAPTVLPMMEISRFSVGHDLASLNTLSWKRSHLSFERCNWLFKVIASFIDANHNCRVYAKEDWHSPIWKIATPTDLAHLPGPIPEATKRRWGNRRCSSPLENNTWGSSLSASEPLRCRMSPWRTGVRIGLSVVEWLDSRKVGIND